jgi:hypothetical protein
MNRAVLPSARVRLPPLQRPREDGGPEGGVRLLGVPLRQAHRRDLPRARVSRAPSAAVGVAHWLGAPPRVDGSCVLCVRACLCVCCVCVCVCVCVCTLASLCMCAHRASVVASARRCSCNRLLWRTPLDAPDHAPTTPPPPPRAQVWPRHHAHLQPVQELLLLLRLCRLRGILCQPPPVHQPPGDAQPRAARGGDAVPAVQPQVGLRGEGLLAGVGGQQGEEAPHAGRGAVEEASLLRARERTPPAHPRLRSSTHPRTPHPRCHIILANLRKPGEKGYKIPAGFLFNYITCANYFAEIMGWVCFSIATQVRRARGRRGMRAGARRRGSERPATTAGRGPVQAAGRVSLVRCAAQNGGAWLRRGVGRPRAEACLAASAVRARSRHHAPPPPRPCRRSCSPRRARTRWPSGRRASTAACRRCAPRRLGWIPGAARGRAAGPKLSTRPTPRAAVCGRACAVQPLGAPQSRAAQEGHAHAALP